MNRRIARKVLIRYQAGRSYSRCTLSAAERKIGEYGQFPRGWLRILGRGMGCVCEVMTAWGVVTDRGPTKGRPRQLINILDMLGDVLVKIGLVQQGHIPIVEQMLEEGASWDQIGAEIGWCPDTARSWYAVYLRLTNKPAQSVHEEIEKPDHA